VLRVRIYVLTVPKNSLNSRYFHVHVSKTGLVITFSEELIIPKLRLQSSFILYWIALNNDEHVGLFHGVCVYSNGQWPGRPILLLILMQPDAA
jgi:hypothetical protein